MRGRVEISGINTAKLPVLKNDEMTALLRRAHAGDTAAREQLICGNLRLVLSVLQRFAGRERRRPVPSGVHRFDEGHRQL